MCTVVIRVPPAGGEPVRVLAVRDEDPSREWNPLGPWWPDEHPGVVGVRDARAGGAWLAAHPAHARLAVLLNRAEVSELAPPDLVSRGGVVLDSASGHPPEARPATHGFNLVEVEGSQARVVRWDGHALRVTPLVPGTHMIAHDEIDDASTPRIARWLDAFREAPPAEGAEWWRPWLGVLAASADLDSTDDRAIIRDNRPYGYPTQSLLVCTASVDRDRAEVRYGELEAPARWGEGLDLS